MKEFRFWLKFFGFCAVLGGLVFFFVMKMVLRGGNVEVPDLHGVPRINASLQVQKLGLKLMVIEERFSNQVPFGSVLEQNIEEGMIVKKGRSIKVVMSRGTRLVQVPQLLSMRSFRQARLLLEQNGLEVGDVVEIHDQAPLGSIVAQSPETGLEVARGSAVSLLVSSGVEAHAWVMPNFIGNSLSQARSQLKVMGLVVRQVNLIKDDLAVPGSVVYQNISAGAKVESGLALDLTVAQGDPETSKARYALIEFLLEDVGVAERRVQVVVSDLRGRRIVFNSMEKPGAQIRVETKAWGSASYRVSVGGREIIEKEIP